MPFRPRVADFRVDSSRFVNTVKEVENSELKRFRLQV